MRAFLTSYLPDPSPQPAAHALTDVLRNVAQVHNLYQRASYSAAARRNQSVAGLLPELVNALARQTA